MNGASIERCGSDARFAVVTWSLPSAESSDGLTVAALATHMLEALYAAASSRGAWRAAEPTTLASDPVNPRRRSQPSAGRGCGGRTTTGMPREWTNAIRARLCRAAAFGFEMAPPCRSEARFPGERPA